jgi:predicted O-methyltransferase YrrM
MSSLVLYGVIAAGCAAAAFAAITALRFRKTASGWMNETSRQISAGFKQSGRDYEQVEALFSIFSVLKIKFPLPEMKSWSIRPDFAKHLVSEILAAKPAFILEAGSGVSTVIAAYALQLNGAGRIVSLDHQEKYAAKTRRQLELHGLSAIATVVYAPLKDHSVAGKKWKWYDLENAETAAINLMIVDGPPADIQPLSRYPALPLLEHRLAPGAILMMDDVRREDEKEILKAWQREYPAFDSELVNTERGMLILRKK